MGVTQVPSNCLASNAEQVLLEVLREKLPDEYNKLGKTAGRHTVTRLPINYEVIEALYSYKQ